LLLWKASIGKPHPYVNEKMVQKISGKFEMIRRCKKNFQVVDELPLQLMKFEKHAKLKTLIV